MPLMEIDWHPGKRQLRVFGFSALIASAILALVLVFVWGAAPIWAAILPSIGAAILLCSLISLRATRIVYIVLTAIALPIGFVLSYVLLATFYFLLLTPIALFFRLIGRDPLHRGLDRAAGSYWVPRGPPGSLDRYFHQS